jgi:hypothetical protein
LRAGDPAPSSRTSHQKITQLCAESQQLQPPHEPLATHRPSHLPLLAEDVQIEALTCQLEELRAQVADLAAQVRQKA